MIEFEKKNKMLIILLRLFTGVGELVNATIKSCAYESCYYLNKIKPFHYKLQFTQFSLWINY